MVPDRVFKLDDIVDIAAAKMPAMKSPPKPGTEPPTSMTKYGRTWSIFFVHPATNGSHVSYFAYICKPVTCAQILKQIIPIRNMSSDFFTVS